MLPPFSQRIKLRIRYLQKKVNILYKNIPLNSTTIIVCATLVFLGVRNTSHVPYLQTWYITVLLIALYRFLLLAFYKHSSNHTKIHLQLYFIGSLATAACWGIIGSLLMPADHIGQMIIIIIMTGISAGALQSLTVNLPIILIYLTLMAIPLCIWLFLQNEPGYFFIFLSMCMYYVFATFSAYRTNRILSEVLKLHFINLTLMENITESNIELHQSNTLLAQQENDTNIVNKLNKILQLCQNSEEAYAAVKNAGEQLFPNINAAFSINDAYDVQHLVVEWGSQHIVQPSFNSDDCWALRSGDIYKVKAGKTDELCHHYTTPPEGTSHCIPLNVSTGQFGLLYFNIPKNMSLSSHTKQMMTTFAETIKVGISSIKLQEELRQQATHDPLTGLYNRRYLTEALDRELNHILRNSGKLCVAFFDIDGFKKYNDFHGHDAGDEVLKMLAGIITKSIRKVDIISRFGGEEFVLVLVDTDIDKVLTTLENFKKEVCTMRVPFKNGFLDPISISIGVAEAPKNGNTVDTIIQAADNAMYIAKKAGGNQIVVAGAE